MATRFIKVSEALDAKPFIVARLTELAGTGRPVLFLVPGGSAAGLAAAVLAQLKDYREQLVISLTDERYGQPDHAESNWRQLINSGFSTPGWQIYEVLTGKAVEPTTQNFNDFLASAIADRLILTGLFGLGADGHTAGILPDSPALTSNDWACHYTADDFERITTTAKFLAQLDEAFIYAAGSKKHEQIAALGDKIDMDRQPAQILKQAQQLTVFNDIKGDNR